MKQEIINCLTWYANKVSETVQYTTWSDEFCRKNIKGNTETFINELKKYIDFNNLSDEECKELRFGRFMDNDEIDDEIEGIKNNDKLSEDEKNKRIESYNNIRDMRLIPLYLLPLLPIGTEVISIGGEIIKYDGKNIDDDIRFGCLAYGIKPKMEEDNA